MTLRATVRAWNAATRPVHPETRAVLARRWAELPESARTPAQTLGQHAVGCEGTHGVFPRCNLACTPCYHSRTPTGWRSTGPTPAPPWPHSWGCSARPAAPARTPSSSAVR